MIVQPFPSEAQVYQWGEEYQLGAPVGVYRRYVTLSGKVALTGIFLLIPGIIGLALSIFSPDLYPEPFPANLLTSYPAFGQALFSFGMFLSLVRHEDMITPLHPRLLVAVYTDGFIYCKGRRTQIVRWEQITSIQRQFVVGRRKGKIKRMRPAYLCCVVGQPALELSAAIANVGEVGTLIERKLTARFLPQARFVYEADASSRDYQPGASGPIAGVTLTCQALVYRGQEISWEQVSQIVFAPDKLIIKQKESQEKDLKIPLSNRANVCVLPTLFEEIQREKGFDLILEPGGRKYGLDALEPLDEKNFILLPKQTSWVSTVVLVLLVLLLIGAEVISGVASFQPPQPLVPQYYPVFSDAHNLPFIRLFRV